MYRKVELIILVLILIGLAALSRNLQQYVSSNQVTQQEDVIVIDAGHGGFDPGKIGVNQAKEKDINLIIAKKVKEKIEKRNIKVVMTRDKDTTLAEDNDVNKKVQDMKARVQTINKTAPALVVSIHQNSYSDEKVHGAQVFYYSHSEKGKRAA